MIIGIDIGSTTTKAVSIEDGQVTGMLRTRGEDALTSAAGAFGKMLIENRIRLPDISRIMITGAGATKIKTDLFGIPTERVDEINAIGVGGMFLSGKNDIVIANIGTGTAIIYAGKDRIVHLGGSGVGGGTILGLAKKILRLSSFNDIMELARQGNVGQVDLLLEDIMETDISFLHHESTASNFGKMLDTARNEDIALGIINLVFQVIGMMAVFAARSRNLDRVIITGSGSHNPIGQEILDNITRMHAVHFEYPKGAEYTTAVGAGLSGPQF
jgi:type II pantothenate kinase